MSESLPANEGDDSVFTPYFPVLLVPSFANPALTISVFLYIRRSFYFANNRVDIKIIPFKWMSITTLSPSSVSLFSYLWSIAPNNIESRRNWFKMARINAFTITTEMVKLQRFVRKRTHYEKINNSMRQSCSSIPFKTTIPMMVNARSPIPALGRWINFNLNTQTVGE